MRAITRAGTKKRHKDDKKALKSGKISFVLVSALDVSKDYGPTQVLSGVYFAMHAGNRIGLVGRNGAGKSTLLRLLLRDITPDDGSVKTAPNVHIRSLSQDPKFVATMTIDQVLESAFHELDALETELSKAAEAMSSGSHESILHHEALLEHYERRGGFERRSRKDAVSLAFGFRGREHDLVSQLSGGERTRLGLAALLVESPDVLLLDEPTNHLDITMVEWLEGFLSRYKGAVLVISHDRTFLDNVTNETAYLRDGRLKLYSGNYSAFREQLEIEQETQAARYAQESKAIADLQTSADRMKIWGLGMSKLARRAKAMQARVDRMKSSATAPPPAKERSMRIMFYAPPSGDVVLDARNITRRLDLETHRSEQPEKRTLFENVQVQLRRGDRVALIGRNGTGKTTLLRTLLGLEPSDAPDANMPDASTLLGARVSVGYYDQALRGVDPAHTLYDVARSYTEKDTEAHDLLGTFMFPYDQHDKPTRILSGGERARLALLKLAQEDHNFLVLDEPTNHLDMEMLETLEGALSQFSGTLLMVSHDRTFIEGLAERVWLLEDGKFYEYLGWDDYKEKHAFFKAQEQEQIQAQVPLSASPISSAPAPSRTSISSRNKGKSLWQLRRDVEALETRVTELEAELEQAQMELGQAAPNADFAALGKRVNELENDLMESMDAWSETQADVETLEQEKKGKH